MTATDLPAILGGTAIRDGEPYPPWPQWDDTERRMLGAALESGAWWSESGTAAKQFAADFAAYHGATFGLPVTNGTHAIEAALAACGVGHGDEVIVPALTFVATATAVLAVNATPVIVDVDPETLCLDLTAAMSAVGPRTKAIVAVHVAGATTDIDALVQLCAEHNLHLIEDCAHAHGTFWRGRGVGTFGSFGCFSFQESKLLTAGEGGLLLCSDTELRDRAASYINCGRTAGGHWYHHATVGSNLRMTEWQGAVLSAQLARFSEQNATRNANALALAGALCEIPGLRAQRRDARLDSQGYYCFVWHYDMSQFDGLPLARFEAALRCEGIPLGVSYPSLSTLAVFRAEHYARAVPAAERAALTTVWMEHRVLLADRDDVLDVARAALRIQRHARAIAA